MRRCVVLTLALPLACGTPRVALSDAFEPRSSAELVNEQSLEDLPYDRAVMKATHNAYARDESLFDQLVYHRVRSLELDVHTRRAGRAAPPSDWFVYHVDFPFMRKSSCTFLSKCLEQVAAFHASVPEHEVVTLSIDLKDRFGAGHEPADLDHVLEDVLGKEAVVRPADLLARCPSAETLRDAVSGSCGFPTLAELRGKVLVTVTGGSLCSPSSPTSAYVGSDPSRRLAFAAPDLGSRCPIERYDRLRNAVFLNVAYGERARVRDVRARGLVARLYRGGLAGGLDCMSEFSAARRAGAQILATDQVNADHDPWSTTASRRGGPFGCAGCGGAREHAEVVTARAISGELGGRHDGIFFAYERDEGKTTWSAYVSVPSSHVEPLAKACLMARASDAPDAVHVALCRPFGHEPPRLLVRRASGAETVAVELGARERSLAGTAALVRLSVEPAGGSRSEAHAEVSVDGRRWVTLARTTVDSPLPLRGIALASHGVPVKALFGNLRREHAKTTSNVRADRLVMKTIGNLTRGEAFDGF